MTAAKIKDVRIAAAHEGIAELIVTVEYDNGGISEIALDQVATGALMQSCQADSAEDLIGQSWELVRDALQVSYNRFA